MVAATAIKMEPTSGLEPLTCSLPSELLYLLSYVGTVLTTIDYIVNRPWGQPLTFIKTLAELTALPSGNRE